MKRNNIPSELRALNQWVVANTPDKIPYNPRTGIMASVTDPSTWGSYDEACKAVGFAHIGFVLAPWGNITIIDLDNKPEKPLTEEQYNRHESILAHFQSYTEKSQSGMGYHIIVHGKIPSGVHRENVEVYSSGRYMICTGDVVKPLPITDYQPSLDNMFAQMKPHADILLEQYDSDIADADLVEMASNAVNGEKFISLCKGEMAEYPSQSEADLALLSMLAFYTRDNDQCRRIFRMTALGKREKAIKNNTYLDYALSKIRGNEPPPIDLTALASQPITLPHKQSPSTPIKPAPLQAPPGLIGEVAGYIYNSAVRPVPEIALAASLAFFSGICGRQYNTYTKTGLNQYMILLAGTGKGKEGARSGIDQLFDAIRNRIPAIEMYRGAAAFSSGPAVIKSLAQNPCQLSVLGEFGLTLQRISHDRANGAEQSFLACLLDLYNQSGFNRRLGISKYSDKEKDTAIVIAPNLTILGESTPETFLAGLDESMVAAGLIPRFLIIEYEGQRPYLNKNAGFAPDENLLNRICLLVETVMRMAANNNCCVVPLDADAQLMDAEFETWTTDEINRANNGPMAELWNRAHLKALKLATLLAVGVDPINPIVTKEVYTWARQFAVNDAQRIGNKFSTGDVGQGESKQRQELLRLIEKYFQDPAPHDISKGDVLHKGNIIPKAYLMRRTSNLMAFKSHKLGARAALNEGIKDLVDSGLVVEISKVDLMRAYGYSGVGYTLARQ